MKRRHSGDIVPEWARHCSRRCLALAKNSSMAAASSRSSASWNSCKSSMKTPSTRHKFLRLASYTSRHISGELAAMRVVSRKPLAQTSACSRGCAGLKT